MLANAFRSEESLPMNSFPISPEMTTSISQKRNSFRRDEKKSHSSSRLRLICDFSSGKQSSRRKCKLLCGRFRALEIGSEKMLFFLPRLFCYPIPYDFLQKNPANPWWVLGCSFEFRNSTLLLQQGGEEIKQSRTLTPSPPPMQPSFCESGVLFISYPPPTHSSQGFYFFFHAASLGSRINLRHNYDSPPPFLPQTGNSPPFPKKSPTNKKWEWCVRSSGKYGMKTCVLHSSLVLFGRAEPEQINRLFWEIVPSCKLGQKA